MIEATTSGEDENKFEEKPLRSRGGAQWKTWREKEAAKVWRQLEVLLDEAASEVAKWVETHGTHGMGR